MDKIIIDNLMPTPPTDTDQLQTRIDTLEAENAYLRHQLKASEEAVRQVLATLGAVL